MMTHVKFKKGAVGALHRHPHVQVTYIESGSFEVRIGEHATVLKAGDCYYVPTNVDHGVVATEDGSLVDVFAPARADFLTPKD
ncbi:MAG: cupin domain-containing protein [Ignavibacteriae bacterium]|nr:cupin domain-containing protein [Ignavibacteriota bacterium]